MQFTIELENTPQSPKPGMPFTETSFVRTKTRFTLTTEEIGVALVDLWNVGWENGPVSQTFGPELTAEFGLSHAIRKRSIVEQVIVPTVTLLRNKGVQIFHCNHEPFLRKYPQWLESTTKEERRALEDSTAQQQIATPDREKTNGLWPPPSWVQEWRDSHADIVSNTTWMKTHDQEVYPQLAIPEPARPCNSDLLIVSTKQFHRLLTERHIRALFYMGFEVTDCIQYSAYGMANLSSLGYLCTIVRDGTTTFEVAETLDGLWRTAVAIHAIEAKWGYSTTSQALIGAIEAHA